MAIAEAGELALSLVIETAASPDGGRWAAKRVWKAMDANSGAYAAIFIAHGLAATSARLAAAPGHHLSVDRLEDARGLLRETFPWSNDDDRMVREAALQVQPEDASGVDAAHVTIALMALAKILGEDAAKLPGIAGFFGEDDIAAYQCGLGWQICFNHVLPRFVRLIDAQGLSTWSDNRTQS